MGNSKKEWQNMSSDEKFVQIFVNIFANAVWMIAIYFMYFDPQNCDSDKIGAWCCVHPTSFWDILGTAFLVICCFWLSGVWGYFVSYESDGDDIWSTLTKVAWGLGVSGILLICLL